MRNILHFAWPPLFALFICPRRSARLLCATVYSQHEWATIFREWILCNVNKSRVIMSSIFLWPPLFTLVIIWACRYNALLLSASVHQRWWSVFGEAGWYINTVRIGIIIRHLFLGPSVHQWRRSIFEEASWNIKIRTGVIFRLLCCLLAFFIQTCRDNTLLFCPRVHQRRWPLFGKAGCIEVRLSSVIRIDYWIWHSGPTWQIGMHWSWSVVHFFPVTSIESCCAFCLKPLIQF